MDKLITNKNNILRICAGNDFSIIVQITEYDTEASAWVNYDLSAVSDVHMSLVSENGKRIGLPVTVNEDGTASASILSAYLQKSVYGIELTWLTNSLNRRTYAPCLLQIVNTTAESTSNIAEYESNDAYHFNIKIKSDVALLSVGHISDEYITEDELSYALESYVTKSDIVEMSYVNHSELDETLSSYATKTYVTNAIAEIPQPDMSAYLTKDEAATTYLSLDDAHNSYVTKVYLSEQSYVNNNELDETLSSYATKTYVADVLEPYVTQSDIVDMSYVNHSELDETLSSYATKSYVTDAISQIPQPDMSAYLSKDEAATTYLSLDDAHNSYVTKVYLSEQSYVTYNDLQDAKDWTYTYFVTTEERDNFTYATAYALNDLNDRVTYIEENGSGGDVDLSSYVAYTDWDNSNEAVAYFITNQTLFNQDLYTKQQVDTIVSSYATMQQVNSVLQNYVSTTVNESQNQAIAYAISYLNDLILSHINQ